MSTLTLSGSELTIDALVAAASNKEVIIEIEPSSLIKMKENRQFAEKVASRGDEVYGLSTGVGMRKKRAITAADMILFNQRMIREHATGQGPPLSDEIARGAAILLLNTLAAGRSNVRPEVALHFLHRINHGPPLAPIPLYGATGVGDVTPLAHLTQDLLGDMEPAAGEALPLIAQSSVVTCQAALAVHAARVLLHELTVLAVLDIEAYAANPTPYHNIVGQVRPYPGLQHVLSTINTLLQGSALRTSVQRHLQSPLSFRSAASMLGAAYDALTFCEAQISIELNAHQQNPLAFHEEDRMLPVANFDMQPIASALDFIRIAIAPCLTAQCERSVKLLQARETGLTDGLEPVGDEMGHGLSEITWSLQGMTAEARLLIQPVSAEIGSASQAEGIEDRMTMAGLSARRVMELVDLGSRVASISTAIACQGISLRGVDRLGRSMRHVYDRVRQVIPALSPGDAPPTKNIEAFVDELRCGVLYAAAMKE